MFIKTSLWQMLSIAMHNLATFYIVAGLVSESCREIENCSVRHGFRCNNREMRLWKYFCRSTFCVELQALCLWIENLPVSAFMTAYGWAWHHARINALQWLGSLRLVKYVIGQAEYLLDSLAIKVGSLARSSCSMLLNGYFSLIMPHAE